MNESPTRYAKTFDGLRIAYRIFGQGPTDIVLVPSAYISNVELALEWSFTSSLIRGLAARSRLIFFDRRGCGLSDGVSAETLPTLDARMEDIRTVMDAAGSERAVLYGMEDGGAQCFLFAATYPERTSAVIAAGANSSGRWTPEKPWQWTEDQTQDWCRKLEEGWGTPALNREIIQTVWPSLEGNSEFAEGYGRLVRHAMSPRDAIAAELMAMETDVEQVLPTIQAPTLIFHLEEGQWEPIEEAQHIAELVPGAQLAVMSFHNQTTWSDKTFEPIDRFLASLSAEQEEFDRVLATVLFTDIVASTEKAVSMGDSEWKTLLERHHQTIRALLGRFRGNEVDTAGDGFFATFDGPARAIRCALAIRESLAPLGLEVRSGLHTGECQTIDGKVGGVSVVTGTRVGALANANEVLVSQTVKDLVAGSGLTFEPAGEHELKGVPDSWHLYRVMSL